jgi:ankyrin repeat protein
MNAKTAENGILRRISMKNGGLAAMGSLKTRAAKAGAFMVTHALAILAVLTLCAAHTHADASPAVPELGSGDLHALVVGVSKYKDPAIPPLELADGDARAFGEFLKTQRKLFRDIKVTFRLNEQATKAEVEKFLYYTLHKVGKNDTVILFFSGHGAFDPVRPKDFLFLTYDAEPDYLGATAVKMSGMEFLKGVEAERTLIIADACHSGGFSQMKPKAPTSGIKQFLKEVKGSTGCAVITSGKEGQLSWEMPNLKNSVFTHNLIDGLKGKADRDHDGMVTLNEAYQYAYNLTREETGGRQHPQFEGKVVGAFPLAFVGPPLSPAELKQRLFPAAQAGDTGKIEQLLASGLDVNARNEENDTPLLVAAKHGRTEAVKLLLEKGADVEARNDARMTALTAAAAKGAVDAVKALAARGADVNHKTADGSGALALAAANGHPETVQALLDAGADVRARTNSGKTALAVAAGAGNTAAAKLLIARGAQLDARDLDGATPLIEAARRGRSEMVGLLMSHGASVKMKSGREVDARLLAAVLANDLKAASDALAQGAEVNASEESGDTALTPAAALGRTKLLTLLLDAGANVHVRNGNDDFPLLQAARSGKPEAVRLLMDRGANPDAKDKEGNSALSVAAEGGHADVVQLLIAGKADVHTRNTEGKTPLILAASIGRHDIIRRLLTAGADPSATDHEGANALITAAGKGYLEAVQTLLGTSVDVNAKNRMGRTALLLAAKNGHKAVVKALTQKGANIAVEDWEGKTAVKLATDAGHRDIADMIASKHEEDATRVTK